MSGVANRQEGFGADAAADAIAVADEDAREQATDPERSVLLQAPAGSGKTTVLTQRLLRLLAGVDEPEEILAITFTRKAAAEMRARVLKALTGEIDTGNPQGVRLRELADAALRRAAIRGWNLAEDPGRLRIQTIDSFNFALAAQLPVASKAGGALVISERPGELYRRAARQTLVDAESDATLCVDAALLFERLDNNWRNVERLLEDMLKRRGHWLRHVLGDEPDALCERVSASLANICRDRLAGVCERLPAALRRQLSVLPTVGALDPEPECLGAWKRLAELCFTKEGEWRKVITKGLGTEFQAGGAKDALRSCIDGLKGVRGAQEGLLELAALPGARLSPEDVAAIKALSGLLCSAAAHLQAEFSAAGRVDHTYIAGAARVALSEAGSPTDLALRTGLSLRHILVDEFQDTSLAQFDLVEALTAGWDEGEGRTLFVVGDPMQSIYQFREAEVGLFLRARDHGIGGVRLQPLRLMRNFRSVPAIIEWTNDTFGRLFPERDDLRSSCVAFTPSLAARTERAADAPVRLRLFPDADRTGEAEMIARRILELRNIDPAGSTAVLVASRAHAVPVISALDAHGIPSMGVDLVPLGELPIVRDLVALLQAMHHLGDRTAWLTVLRAPWCGVSLATLTQLSHRHDPQLVWQALADPDRLGACEASERVRLERIREVLEQALATRSGASLAEWLEGVWVRLGAPDAYPAQHLRHARAFFTALGERVSAGEWSGPQDLGSLLSELFAQPEAPEPAQAEEAAGRPRSPAVQIMTIHRAKGLEFDHVFLPALDRNPARAREPLLRWLDLPREEGDSDLVMSPVPTIGDDAGGDVGRYIKRLISERESNEQTRLLYVAATRARQTLFLSAAPKVKPDGRFEVRSRTLLSALWPVLESSFVCGSHGGSSAAADAPGSMDRRSSTRASLLRLVADWSPLELESTNEPERLPLARQSLEQELEFSWVQETSRSIGTVVHAQLEQFASAAELPTRAAIESARGEIARQLQRHGVPAGELQGATDTVLKALTRTVEDPRGRWIFSSEHADANSELALTGLSDSRLTNVVIDRSFIDRDGLRWVIDFKTSPHAGGGLEAFLDQELDRYEAQLRRYVELARRLGPQPVRAALYFPLLGAFRELA